MANCKESKCQTTTLQNDGLIVVYSIATIIFDSIFWGLKKTEGGTMGGGDVHKEPTPPNKANSTKLDSSFWKLKRGGGGTMYIKVSRIEYIFGNQHTYQYRSNVQSPHSSAHMLLHSSAYETRTFIQKKTHKTSRKPEFV